MNPINGLLGVVLAVAGAGAAAAEQGTVTWIDPSCGYFVVRLPEGNPAEAFGLFSWKTHPGPKIGDVIEGDILSTYEVEVMNRTAGVKHALLHWANGKSQEQLTRNTPVQCASKWARKKKD
ncbi:MAG TPA: hypothetical protein VFB20_01995 [Burkholderiales bacterium]|nr:hypothetical protein [Burkholderiales bacterium]